jgi:hypothetical protein
MSDVELIADWLRRRNRTAANYYLLGAAAMLLLGLVALAITWWVVYLVVWVGFGWLVELAHTGRTIVACVVVVLLFPLNAFTDRRELEQFSFTTGTAHGQPVSFYIPTVGMGSTINPLAPDSFLSFTRALATLLLIGPRLVTAAFQMAVLAMRLRVMDWHGVAEVLAFLASRDNRAPFKSIVRTIPPEHDVQTVLNQLREVDGVMYLLHSEPTGVSLSTELRGELRQLLKSSIL